MSLWAGLGSHVSQAGDDTLGDYEGSIERREQKEDQVERSDADADGESGSDEALGAAISSALVLAAGGSSEAWEDRRAGAPATALVRVESSYQSLSSADVDGLTTRAEVIYSFIGVGGEFIRYWEESPDQDLDFGLVEGLIRIVPSEYVRLTLAAGSRHIAGRRSRWAHGGGFSIGLYPLEWLGIEADLRWAEVSDRTSGDYRIGALLRVPHFPYLALRGGYRVIQYQNETLDGPEVGLVGTW